MRAVTVSIVHSDSRSAGREVAAELLAELGRSPEAVLLFVSSRLDPREVLAGLTSRLPTEVMIAGCSSFAEINSEEGLSLSVTAMGFAGIECKTFKVSSLLPDSREAGRILAAQVKAFAPSLLITFPDGIVGNSAEYVRGLQDVLGLTFPIIGGVAAEHLCFERTHEICDGEVLSGGAVALAIRGTTALATAAKSGFQPIGAARTVTKTQGPSCILEIDGQPALRLYRDFLGDAAPSPQMIGLEFPLLLVCDPAGNHMESDEQINVVRVVRSLDEEKGALVLGGEIAVGTKIRLTHALKADLLSGAVEAVESARQRVPSPDVAFIFGCAGRKLLLGPHYQEEIQRAFAAIGQTVPKIGFYTYGELSPVHGVTTYHDETFSIALLRA